ncbi:MAG: MtnX-like HAD-IB family phosphatase [Melioribacteraceae bacterium]|nr:MtnX-like HAD-IB family phosphatase [Melioribacteraceae bacterium]
MPDKRNFKIFIDFDGTITTQDVGEQMFLKFGDAREARKIVERWISKEITSTQSWELLCATISDFNEEEFDVFLDEIIIDPTFFEFERYCNENGIALFVLSDGLDYYINRIFSKNNLDHLNVYSNRMIKTDDNKIKPVFPYSDEECKMCANCKRNHIINNSSDDDITVYIGDGYSDTCPAQYVDYIFAKNSLLKFCEKERISYFPFNNFGEIKIMIEELRTRRRLRKRHQAELKRKEVYQQG